MGVPSAYARLPQDPRNIGSHTCQGDVLDSSVRPLWPAPRTTTYGHDLKWRPPPADMPSQALHCEGWGQACLLHKADYAALSYAEKYRQGASQYYIKTDGWVLCFWDPAVYEPHAAEQGLLFPAGWLDLRTVREVERRMAQGSLSNMFPYEILAHTVNGCFMFQVATKEDAIAWISCIETALVEARVQAQNHREEAQEHAYDIEHAVQQPDVAGRVLRVQEQVQRRTEVAVDSRRAQALKELWFKCLRSTMHGQQPQVFDELFTLYDNNGDGNMQVGELTTVLKELVAVRRSALELAQNDQSEDDPRLSLLGFADADLSSRMELNRLAKELAAHYEYVLKDGFQSRAFLLHSWMDTSHDGLVTQAEFVRGAAAVLLPARELLMEAKFYAKVGAHMERQARARGEDDDSEDEGGCLMH